MVNLDFQPIHTTFAGNAQEYVHVYRAQIPGGWLVSVQSGIYGAFAVTFVPDPEHGWDGGSIRP